MEQNNIILINKPVSMSSFEVTSAVRRKLKIKKAGHAGTLDPMASGVLPIMTGRATRLIDLIPLEKKRYSAQFELGMTTDTLDCEGEVQTDQPVLCDEDEIKSVCESFCGEIEQIPPMFSALKSNGQKLYDLARKGIEIERKSRKITIFSIKITEIEPIFDTFRVTIDVVCSKGTYIRTLIDDIGLKLKCGAYMTKLKRLESGGFSVDECVDLDKFMDCENAFEYCISPDKALKNQCAVTVSPAQSKRFSNGGELSADRLNNQAKALNEGELVRVYDDNGAFLGVGIMKNNTIAPKCIM